MEGNNNIREAMKQHMTELEQNTEAIKQAAMNNACAYQERFDNISETCQDMTCSDYKRRFIAEYVQLRIRTTKLSQFVGKIRAGEYFTSNAEPVAHDCPLGMLEKQLAIMKSYLEVLEERAHCEKIVLPKVCC